MAVNLADLLFASTALPGGTGTDGALLVHAGGRDYTRREVLDRAVGLARALAEAGVAEGVPVGVMLPGGVDVVATLFGTWRAGGVYVPLNPRLSGTEVARVLTRIRPAVVVTIAELAERFPGRRLVVVDEGRPRLRPGPAPGPGDRDGPRHDPDVALAQFTSGTTGEPKPVLLRHSGVRDLLDNVIAKLRGARGAAGKPGGEGPATPPMPNLIPVSLSLWAGLYNVLFAFRVGAPVVVMDGFDPQEFVRLVQRFGIRSTVLPPAAMAMLSGDERIDDLSPLRYVRSITAPLSPLQARRFRDRFGISVLNSYGQTEIGGEVVGWNAADARRHGDAKLGSVGRPHAGVEVRAVDDGGTTLGVGEPGELWLRAPARAAGYADGTDLGDRLGPDGWFRTGDVGRVDAEGFVWVEGRVSDMINRGGLKVHPGEVEEALRTVPGVADAAVVGVPDDRLGEAPWAYVVPADAAAPPGADELSRACRAHLAPYKVPVRFEALDALPRNEVGKVLKGALVERAAGRAGIPTRRA